MRRAPIDPGRPPTKKEFDRIAADFAQRAAVALLPGILRSAILDSPQGRLPGHVRHLVLYGPDTRTDSASSAKQTGQQGFLPDLPGNGRISRPGQIDPTRLPTKEEFDRVADQFTEQATLAFLPGILRNAILAIAQSGVLPEYLRHLILYGRYPPISPGPLAKQAVASRSDKRGSQRNCPSQLQRIHASRRRKKPIVVQTATPD